MSGINGPIIGYNLYAYAFNNPVNLDDANGNWPKWVKKAATAVINGVNTAVKAVGRAAARVRAGCMFSTTSTKIIAASFIAVVSKKATINDVIKDFNNYQFYNTDPQMCFKATVFSSYNGTPVIKHDSLGSSFSIANTVVLNRNEYSEDVIKHEWGHTIQETFIGIPRYVGKIATPSLMGYFMDNDDYYSQPWERSADYFGSAINGVYLKGSEVQSTLYALLP